jgi:hypothetical protein
MLTGSFPLQKMVAFNNLARIVAISVVLASTLSSAAPAPTPKKAVDNLNEATNGFMNGITARAEEDKNFEEQLQPILAALPFIANGISNAGKIGEGFGKVWNGITSREEEDKNSGDFRFPGLLRYDQPQNSTMVANLKLQGVPCTK